MKKFKSILLLSVAALMAGACQAASGSPIPSEFSAAPTQAPAIPPQATAMASGAVPVGAPGSADQLAVGPAGPRMVIKNAELELLVGDPDLALDRVTQLAADFGGYIISAQTWQQGDRTHATLRLGIPSLAFESALNQIRAIGQETIRETTSGEDVSAAYVDLDSRLQSLEATAARVRAFLAAANTVEEALQVNERLSSLETQIEQVRGQMRYFEGRAAFSTVTVTLTPELLERDPTPVPEWSPRQTVLEATEVLASGSRVLIDLAIWAAIVLGPLAVVAGMGFWAARKFTGLIGRGRSSAS